MTKTLVRFDVAERIDAGRVISVYDFAKRENRTLTNNGERVKVTRVDAAGDEVEEVLDYFYIGMEATRKLSDAFAAYEVFLGSDILFTIGVKPNDAGLVRLLGGPADPKWHCVGATFRGGTLLTVNIYLDQLDGADPDGIGAVTVFGPTVTIADCRAAIAAALQPRGVIMIPFNYTDVRLSGARGWRSETHSIDAGGWLPRIGPMTTFAAELAAMRLAMPQCDLIYAINDRRPYAKRRADGTHDQFWVHDAKTRGPYMLAQIVQFALALASCSLSPFVVLWIFDWLPYQRYYAEARRLRWIDGVLRSIVGVLERRQTSAKK